MAILAFTLSPPDAVPGPSFYESGDRLLELSNAALERIRSVMCSDSGMLDTSRLRALAAIQSELPHDPEISDLVETIRTNGPVFVRAL